MIKKYLPIFVLLGMFSVMACEPNNPFNTGPAYDEEGNLKIDSAKIVAFLDTAQIDSLYRIHDPSGVVIIVQEEGSGTRPTSNTVVYTDYAGRLLDGTLFDTNIEDIAQESELYDSTRTYLPFQFIIGTGGVIPGWDIGFRRLRPGSKATLVIPSPFAYRDDNTRPRIPENSILVFDIDFLGID
jgi:FKBP-type peptidyl-prolyl cis-trans isomerase FkpA